MRIYDGRDSFYQWDTNQQVIGELKVGDEVHSYNPKQPNALITLAYELDGNVVADVPNILLQSSFPITVYRVYVDENGRITRDEYQFKVKQRPKPSDYVYTETEVLSYKTLEERVKNLEEGGTSGGITQETDPTVPDWAKQPNPPSVNIPTKLPNPHALTFTGAVNATYDGSEAVSVEIPSGGGKEWKKVATVQFASDVLIYEWDISAYSELIIVNITPSAYSTGYLGIGEKRISSFMGFKTATHATHIEIMKDLGAWIVCSRGNDALAQTYSLTTDDTSTLRFACATMDTPGVIEIYAR